MLNIIFQSHKKAKIGTVTIDASVTEKHVLSSTPTKNPVEEGAKITDHVELEPAKLAIQGVISDTPLDFDLFNQLAQGNFKEVGQGLLAGLGNPFSNTSRSTEQYQALVKLRDAREPFEVITGLKVYKNMILTSLEVNRTATTGKALHFSAEMEEIRIVSTETRSGLGSLKNKVGAKSKNLGSKVPEPLDPNKNPKKVQGSSKLFDLIQRGK